MMIFNVSCAFGIASDSMVHVLHLWTTLRKEARLSSNVRLKLKQQLSAEKKRSEVLEEQVTEWKNKFKQLGPGAKPPPS